MINFIKHNTDGSEITSDFNLKEKFTLKNIPKDFKSVHISAVKRLRRSTVEKIERDGELKPGALEMSLKSIDGQFDPAYVTLEGDYNTRRSNLKDAYTMGVMELKNAITIYKAQIANHEIAFRNYSKANKIINGNDLPENLMIPNDEVEARIKAAKELGRK